MKLWNPFKIFAATPKAPEPAASIGGSAQAPAPVENPPIKRAIWLGPRFEPSNISSTATISSVQNAIRQAENGDPTTLFRFYRDSVLGDDHIGGEFDKRKLAVLGEPINVGPADKENADDIAAAAACTQAMEDCENWTDALKALLDSTLWPVSVLENIYRPADAPVTGAPRLLWTLKRLEPVNPMLFCFRHAYFTGGVGLGTSTPVQQANLGNGRGAGPNPYSIDLESFEPFLRLWPIDESGRIIYNAATATPLERARHIVHRGHLLTNMRDNWGGPMRSIGAWWLLRGLGRDWFASFMEKYGSPFPVGKTNAEDQEAVDLLKDAFASAVKIKGLIIDQKDSVELAEASTQGGADGHEKFHNVCNNAISRRIVGQELSASAQPTGMGSGVANLQGQVREDIRMFDQKELCATLKRQVFANLLRFNGLTGRIQVTMGGLSDDDADKLALRLKTLNEAGFEPTDEAVDTIQERFGFSIQRKAAPVQDPLFGGPAQGAPGVRGFSAATAQRRGEHFTDELARKKAEALSAAFKGRYSPIRDIILNSASAEEARTKLAEVFPEMKPGRVSALIEDAMQIAAAAGCEAAPALKSK